MKPTILFLFNTSIYAPSPWLEDGRFNCVSVDHHETDHSGAHKLFEHERHTHLNVDLSCPTESTACTVACLIEIILEEKGLAAPSLVISFAPCTDLAVTGAAHFQKKRDLNPEFQRDATKAARLAEEFGCPYMVENPVSVLATTWRKPDFYWHPWQYSWVFDSYDIAAEHPEFPDILPPYDWYCKKTGAWTGNGFINPMRDTEGGPKEVYPGYAKLGGKSARTKYIRSLTPRGFAYAVYHANKHAILGEKEVDTGYLAGMLSLRMT